MEEQNERSQAYQPYTPQKTPIESKKTHKSLGRVFGETLIKASIWSTLLSFAVVAMTFFSIIALVLGVAASTSAVSNSAEVEKYVHYAGSDSKDANRILLVNINGVILGEGEGGGGLFSEAAVDGYMIQDILVDAASDSSIDGVIMKMDTPGGTIYGSNAIADGVEYYKEQSGNPIVAYVSSMSASGGMLAMAGADKIYADEGTLLGSIGVIFGPFTYYNNPVSEGSFLGSVETKDGIEKEFITAGKGKDAGNSFRRLTDEEKANFQALVDSSYKKFVKHVSDSRNISEDKIINEFGAKLFDETSAKKAGLIDGTKTRNGVYEKMADLAGLNLSDMEIVTVNFGSDSVVQQLFSKFGIKDAPEVKKLKACLPQTALLSYYGEVSSVLCK